MKSRSGPIAAQPLAPNPRLPSNSAVRAGSQSPGASTGSSIRSKPQSFTRGASAARRSSVGGETQIQVLAPIGFFIECPTPRSGYRERVLQEEFGPHQIGTDLGRAGTCVRQFNYRCPRGFDFAQRLCKLGEIDRAIARNDHNVLVDAI